MKTIQTFYLFGLLLFALAINQQMLAAEGDRVALVIGVDVYDNLPKNAQLQVAARDARLIARTLEAVEPWSRNSRSPS
jgi:hypothetical protein